MIGVQSFGIAIGYYTICAVACGIVFGICRRIPAVKQFYQPRCFYSDAKNKTPQMLPNWAGIIGWIPPVAFFDQVTIYEYSGIDGLVMIRMLYFGIRLFLTLTVLCNAVLLPVYLTGGQVSIMENEPGNSNSYSNMDKVSLTNVQPGDNRLYATVVMAWVITAVMFKMLWHHTQVLVALRILYLQTQDVGDQACTILVQKHALSYINGVPSVQDVPGIVDGTSAHRLLFGWLCCLSRETRLQMAHKVTSLISGVMGMVEAVFDGIGDIISGALFAILHGYVILSHAVAKLFCCPVSDEPFSISGRTWTVGNFTTPTSRSPAANTPQPPASPQHSDMPKPPKPSLLARIASPLTRPFTPDVEGHRSQRRRALDVVREGSRVEVIVHDEESLEPQGMRPWTAPAADDLVHNTLLRHGDVPSTLQGPDYDDPAERKLAGVDAAGLFGQPPVPRSMKRASEGVNKLPPIAHEDSEDGSSSASPPGTTHNGKPLPHSKSEGTQDWQEGHTDLEVTLGRGKSVVPLPIGPTESIEASVVLTRANRNTGSVRRIQLFTEMSAWARAVRMMGQLHMSPQQMVDAEFRGLFRDKFKCAYLVTDTRTVEPVVRKYRKLVTQLLDMFDMFAAQVQRHGNHKLPSMSVKPARWGDWAVSFCGNTTRTKVNKTEFLLAYLAHMRHRVLEAQANAAELYFAASFVTMQDRQTQVLARNVLLHHDTSSWVVRAAPALEDVIWSSLRLRQWERGWRRTTVTFIYIVLAFTYIFPVNAVQLLLGTQTLKSWFETKPLLWSLYSAFVPTLALKIFVWTLPLWLGMALSLRGKVSKVEWQLSMLTTFYMFQVLVVLGGSLLGGAWLTQLQQLLDDPGKIWSQLGSKAAQTSVFFCNYIALQALVTTPLFFLRLPELLVLSIRVSLSYADRAKERIWQTRNITYGANVAWITFAMCLGIVYAPINPIIAPIALLWLLIATLLWKWDLVFVFKQTVSAGGRMWRHIFWHMMVALMAMQIIVAAIVALKRCYPGALMMLAPLVASILFAMAVEKRFAKSTAQLSLRGAADIDDVNRRRSESLALENTLGSPTSGDLYQPSLKGLRHRSHSAATEGISDSTKSAQYADRPKTRSGAAAAGGDASARVIELPSMGSNRAVSDSLDGSDGPPPRPATVAGHGAADISFRSATSQLGTYEDTSFHPAAAPDFQEGSPDHPDAVSEEVQQHDGLSSEESRALELALRKGCSADWMDAAYVNPVMRFDEEEFNAVVTEARYWLRHGKDPKRDLHEMRKVMDSTARLSRFRNADKYRSPRTTMDGRRRSQRDLIRELVESDARPTTV